jgi:hypothetical protein
MISTKYLKEENSSDYKVSQNVMIIRIFFILTILIFTESCIDPYDFDSNRQNKVLVVNGLLSADVHTSDTLIIQYSSDVGGVVKTTPADVSKVVLNTSSNGREINLIEKSAGRFLLPRDFKINPSEKYTLRFTLPNNQQYESTTQQILATPPIDRLYDFFNLKSKLSEDGKRVYSANEIYLDFQDIPNQKNLYLWRYTHYERISHCATCQVNELYFRDKGCIQVDRFNSNPAYDYVCDSECYNIYKGKNVNIFSDITSDGRAVKGRLIAKIPFYSYSGCLIEVEQMCVNPDIFSYYKILESQTQATGGLTDTPAAAIIGNIQNLSNPEEKVIGVFSLANIQKKRYWIDRSNVVGVRELVLGHVPMEEPRSPSRPPTALCQLSAIRTPFKPDGWR